MAEIHYSRGKRPRLATSLPCQTELIEHVPHKRSRRYTADDTAAFLRRLARRRGKKGYKIARQRGRVRA